MSSSKLASSLPFSSVWYPLVSQLVSRFHSKNPCCLRETLDMKMSHPELQNTPLLTLGNRVQVFSQFQSNPGSTQSQADVSVVIIGRGSTDHGPLIFTSWSPRWPRLALPEIKKRLKENTTPKLWDQPFKLWNIPLQPATLNKSLLHRLSLCEENISLLSIWI